MSVDTPPAPARIPADGGPDHGDDHAPRPVHPARLGAAALALIIAGVVLLSYAVHPQLPENAVTLPFEPAIREPVRVVLPQGWQFFTRDPREADPVSFTRDEDDRWRSALLAPIAEPRNVFGLARATRAQGVELGLLAGELSDPDWYDCTTEPVACLDEAPTVAVVNPTPSATLCGEVGLVRQPPVPWAWSRSSADVIMPSTVARLEVSC